MKDDSFDLEEPKREVINKKGFEGETIWEILQLEGCCFKITYQKEIDKGRLKAKVSDMPKTYQM